MNTTDKLVLVDGRFSDEEAREILLNLFSTKIHFHEAKNFSSQERFGKDDATAMKRIPELKTCLDQVREIVSNAKSNKKRLHISAEVRIVELDD